MESPAVGGALGSLQAWPGDTQQGCFLSVVLSSAQRVSYLEPRTLSLVPPRPLFPGTCLVREGTGGGGNLGGLKGTGLPLFQFSFIEIKVTSYKSHHFNQSVQVSGFSYIAQYCAAITTNSRTFHHSVNKPQPFSGQSQFLLPRPRQL